MNVQLRNSNGFPGHVLPRFRRGFGATPMTPAQMQIWSPSGGFTPGSGYGAPAPAVYQAPTLVPTPACASGPPGTSDSAECIAQVLAAEQQNMKANANANYNVDIANCESAYQANATRYAQLGLPVPPDTCGQDTFGLTPAGGFTSDAQTQGPQLYQNAQDQFVTVSPLQLGVDPATGEPALPSGSNAPAVGAIYTDSAGNQQQWTGTGWTLVTPASTSGGGSTAQKIANTLTTGSGSGTAPPASTPINPALYWVAGIAAVALIFAAVK